MMYPLIILPEAQEEMDESFDFYEDREGGLGVRFAESVQRTLDRLSHSPFVHAVVEGDVRKAVVKGFPFCVYYSVEPQGVVVVSVFHTSRDPQIWKSRIK
jgi:plasmid stabilization system protein ParE